jgi:CBS-domain-containing membrane protein
MKSLDVMTKDPVFCLPSDNVLKASQLLKTHDIGSLPVVESAETRMLVGMVTDRDIVLKVVSEGCDPQTTLVKDVMSAQVITCSAEDDMQMALDLMARHQLRRLPVVDAQDKLVGIIAQADLATRMDQPVQTAEILKEVSQAKPRLLPVGLRKNKNWLPGLIFIAAVIVIFAALKFFNMI